MRTVEKSFLFFIILSLTSCSFMVNDFKKMTKGTKYLVEYYQEDVAEYDVNSETQTNEITYSLIDTQILYGEDGTETKAVAKEYIGFTAETFSQEIINPDESTVVKIYYNRNLDFIAISHVCYSNSSNYFILTILTKNHLALTIYNLCSEIV